MGRTFVHFSSCHFLGHALELAGCKVGVPHLVGEHLELSKVLKTTCDEHQYETMEEDRRLDSLLNERMMSWTSARRRSR